MNPAFLLFLGIMLAAALIRPVQVSEQEITSPTAVFIQQRVTVTASSSPPPLNF